MLLTITPRPTGVRFLRFRFNRMNPFSKKVSPCGLWCNHYIPKFWDFQPHVPKFWDFGGLHKTIMENLYKSTNVALRIKEAAKLRNVVVKTLLSECGLSKNTLSSMLSGGSMPKSENLAKIADYLDCSVDYLLGRTDKPEVNK